LADKAHERQWERRSPIQFNSTWAERIASLIIIGLAVEIAAVFIFGKSFWEGAVTILANVLIVAGVWGELIFERRAKTAADGIVAQANARAAEANARAATAQLELRRLSEPRKFDVTKFKEIMDHPKAVRAKVEVLYLLISS
jgi:hypothetical protein